MPEGHRTEECLQHTSETRHFLYFQTRSPPIGVWNQAKPCATQLRNRCRDPVCHEWRSCVKRRRRKIGLDADRTCFVDFSQYSLTFCTLKEGASDVTSGASVTNVDLDNGLKFYCPGLHHYEDNRLKVVKRWHS